MRKSKEFILQKIKKYHYDNNLIGIENVIGRALTEYKGDPEFIKELTKYCDDLKIKNFMNSLGDNTYGFQLFMLKFREKLIEDIKVKIATKQE